MATFENALRADGKGSPAAAYGMMACERVMRLLVKFLDEVDRPHGYPSYGTLHQSSDEATLKVAALRVFAD